jgi:mannose-6-phosphate isomerase
MHPAHGPGSVWGSTRKGSGLDNRPTSVRVDKPWGSFERYTHNLASTVKIITVAPGGVLSSQYHHKRDELWVVLDPGAHVELGGVVVDPEVGEEIFIPRGTVHRLSVAGGYEPVRILEISFGEFEEGDIVRLDDAYGRATALDRTRPRLTPGPTARTPRLAGTPRQKRA